MDDDAAQRRVIGVGASAGGLDALIRLARSLPDDLAAPLLIVLHQAPNGRSLLPQILDRQTSLMVVSAQDGMPLEPGVIAVAPPDRHLLVRGGRIRLERGPRENNSRPAVDPMFRSLAAAYGAGAIAVVLSGALGDGASGARAVAATGGTVLVQDPLDAMVPSMPESTLAAVGPAAGILRADELGAQLGRLAREAAMAHDRVVPDDDSPLEISGRRPEGPPTGVSCPECHGPLWAVEDDHYRCRVGHAYSEEALVGAQSGAVETAIWIALEALEERAELLRRIADRSGSRPSTRERMDAAAADAVSRAELLRRALAGDEGVADTFGAGAEATG